jgi:hypothetical protein
MLAGQNFKVKSIKNDVVTFDFDGRECSYILNPFELSHEGHDPVKVGDVLSAAKDSTPGDSTLVQARCGCRALLRPN